jgi:cobalt-zinc-cadmium efflux system membrane fusion protein
MKPNVSRSIRWWLFGATGLVATYVIGWAHGYYGGDFLLSRLGLERFRIGALVLESPPFVSGSTHSHPHPGQAMHDAGHEHAAAESMVLTLSAAARKSLGLSEDALRPVERRDFQKTISIPGIVVEKPGRTHLSVSAAMTGIVTHVHAESGEAVEAGDLLLEMRLTHEDLVTAQKEFLQSVGEREIERREIERIEELAKSGAISTKSLLDRQYTLDKIELLMNSQRESLRLHGLTLEQIMKIEQERRLLTEIRVVAPSPDDHNHETIQLGEQRLPRLGSVPKPDRPTSTGAEPGILRPVAYASTVEPNMAAAGRESLLILQELKVQKGEIVQAGDVLCTLADYDALLIEGQAFETESQVIVESKLEQRPVVARLQEGGKSIHLPGLHIGWVDNEIDPLARTLKFYVPLENVLVEDARNAAGQRYVSWKYRPGQRTEIGVPVEQWRNQLVLPVDAVARDGLESYVFRQDGDHFHRLAVHELFRDQQSVVIADDGTVAPNDTIAHRAAHQMQLGLKVQMGGGGDPHAGHHH